MRRYTEAERCMLLLFAELGVEKPLSRSVYQTMVKALAALGQAAGEPEKDLTEAELSRLGLSAETAKTVLGRLTQEDALKHHLLLLNRQDITPLTRISPEYPKRLRQVLGSRAPMLLYCAGDLSLFETECVSLVGSRQLRQPGRLFSQRLGKTAAAEKLTYVSGGAAGADTAGFLSAMEAGGKAIVFVADSLKERMEEMERWRRNGQLLLVSEYGFDQRFSAQRAYSRNRLIHAMGQKVFVAQSDYGSGGTWNGVLENLKYSWSRVFMCQEEPEDPGTLGLIERGCEPVRTEELNDLRALGGEPVRLF